jgi:imidazole glycerol-phosphate synthase subunit HisH
MRVAILPVCTSNFRLIIELLRPFPIEIVDSIQKNSFHTISHLVLPGVSSAAETLATIDMLGIRDSIIGRVSDNSIKVVGICAGFHAMCIRSEECSESAGLGLVPADVVLGATVHPERVWPNVGRRTLDGNDLPKHSARYYYNHNFCVLPSDPTDARFSYSEGICASYVDSAIGVYGYQFHPERSGIIAFRGWIKEIFATS